MTLLRLLRLVGLLSSARSPLAARAVRLAVLLVQLLLQQAKLLFDLCGCCSARFGRNPRCFAQLHVKAANFVVLDFGDGAQQLDVFDAIDVHHRRKCYRTTSDFVATLLGSTGSGESCPMNTS